MKPIPYNQEDLWYVELENTSTGEIYDGRFIDFRLDRDTIPKGKFAYDCRHGDDDWDSPITIEKRGVRVNFAGVFVTDKEIIFPKNKDYIPIKLADAEFYWVMQP